MPEGGNIPPRKQGLPDDDRIAVALERIADALEALVAQDDD